MQLSSHYFENSVREPRLDFWLLRSLKFPKDPGFLPPANNDKAAFAFVARVGAHWLISASKPRASALSVSGFLALPPPHHHLLFLTLPPVATGGGGGEIKIIRIHRDFLS